MHIKLRHILGILLAATLATGCTGMSGGLKFSDGSQDNGGSGGPGPTPTPAPIEPSQVTYYQDIAPIISSRCLS
ncbi:MAG TPA: hypothetical protein VFV50_00495, partial [Bdellovibrionales bacterium]|nr:hypothetical protein [Bdellovibrionales bacterium]